MDTAHVGPALDTSNRYKVVWGLGEAGDLLALFEPPLTGQRMTREDALVLAGWLLSVADRDLRRFPNVYRQILES